MGYREYRMCIEKRLYVTEKDAAKAVRGLRRKGIYRAKYYPCPICHGFHVTHHG